MNTDHEFDAIVVGGSYAGMSAAMQLARARRQVLVVDAGARRNRYAASSHGFLGRDGSSPAQLAAEGKADLLAYDTVHWIDGAATHASTRGDGFALALASGRHYQARRLVLATGVVDELPPVEGLAERWGRSVFHCPYCHGYELNQGRIGVLASGPLSQHHALLLPDWGQVILFTNEAYEPDPEQLAALARRGVQVEAAPVRRVSGVATVELADGRQLEMAGLFTLTRTSMASPLAQQLGCAFDEGPTGPVIRTDAIMAASVPGVFACGDAGRMMSNIALAVADGALAGVAAHRSLIF